MTERERLIELLKNNCSCINEDCKKCGCGDKCFIYREADYLLDNDVIVPPCKVGDTVYYVCRGRIEQLKIRNINYSFRDREYYVYLENDSGSAMHIDYHQLIGYKLFHTLEEAEKALEKERARK